MHVGKARNVAQAFQSFTVAHPTFDGLTIAAGLGESLALGDAANGYKRVEAGAGSRIA